MLVPVGQGCAFEWSEVRDLGVLDAIEKLVRLAFLDYRPFDVLKLKQRGILHLVDLDGIVLDFPELEESILHKTTITLTMSLFILNL